MAFFQLDGQPPAPDDDERSALEWLVIGILTGIALVASYFLWATPVSGQVTSPPSQQTRDTVYPTDPDRAFTVLWSRGNPDDPDSIGLIRRGDLGDLDSVSLKAADGTIYKTTTAFIRERTEFESWHWKSFRVEQSVPVGTYTVLIAGRERGSITVAQVRPPGVIRRLAAGEVRTNQTLTSPTQLRGHGCTLTGNLTISTGCTVTGLTIDGDVTGNFTDCVFDSCVFRRGQVGPMGESDRGCLFRDCRFENTTVATCSSGLFLRCSFTGRPAKGTHNFCNERATRLAVINCTWDDTDRGIIARPRWGDNSDNLYAGLWFRHIAQTNNGDELLCVEGQGNPAWGFNRNLIFGVRSVACHGPLLLFSSQASHNLFNNVRVPVEITGIAKQTGNVVQDSECEYVRVNWPGHAQATNTVLRDVYSVGFRPRARNQATGDPQFWHDSRYQAVFQDSSPNPTTIGYNLRVEDPASGYTATKGIR